MDYSKAREYGRRYSRYKWYKDFKSIFEKDGFRKAARFLRHTHPQVWFDLSRVLNIGYRQTLTVSHFLAVLYPNHLNTCNYCGSFCKYHSDYKWWSPFCSVSCASLGNREAFEKTMMERYGVIHALSNPELVLKFKRNHKKVMLERYGVVHAHQNPELRKRFESTMLERYGVVNATSNADIMSKSISTRSSNSHNTNGMYNSKYRTLVDKFGTAHRVQGYEDLLITLLAKRNNVLSYVTEICSMSQDIPSFRYRFNGEYKNYFPDFLVKTKRGQYVVEVKSPYTLNVDLRRNISKFKTATRECLKTGKQFMLVIFKDRDDKKPIVVLNPKTAKEIRRA